jgi:hypothetical protein
MSFDWQYDLKLLTMNKQFFHISECFESFYEAKNYTIECPRLIDKEDKEEDIRFKYRTRSTIHSTCECCGSQNLQEFDVWIEPEEDSHKVEPILSDVRQICRDCRAVQY